jgi:hypothetical protein
LKPNWVNTHHNCSDCCNLVNSVPRPEVTKSIKICFEKKLRSQKKLPFEGDSAILIIILIDYTEWLQSRDAYKFKDFKDLYKDYVEKTSFFN